LDLKLSLTVRPSESVVTDVELKAAQSDVLYQDAPRALEDEQTAVFVMVGAKDVNLLAAARVHRGALISARQLGSGGSCERFSRGKNGLCVAHNALVEDSQVLPSGETLGAMGSSGSVMNSTGTMESGAFISSNFAQGTSNAGCASC
jgi:hypothetical protein